MKLELGQRWRYVEGSYNFLVEIIELNPIQTKILQANPYAISCGYYVGKVTGSNGVGEDYHCDRVWFYLQGQDKPK